MKLSVEDFLEKNPTKSFASKQQMYFFQAICEYLNMYPEMQKMGTGKSWVFKMMERYLDDMPGKL